MTMVDSIAEVEEANGIRTSSGQRIYIISIGCHYDQHRRSGVAYNFCRKPNLSHVFDKYIILTIALITLLRNPKLF